MEKEFIPYELAVKLKDIGFDKLCLCHYHYGNILRSKIVSYVEGDCLKLDKFDKSVPAPLWQQAFDWFREKYKLNKTITPDCFNKGLLEFKIDSIDKSIVLDEIYESNYWVRLGCFKTYQEARQACLEKLIEIVENERI